MCSPRLIVELFVRCVQVRDNKSEVCLSLETQWKASGLGCVPEEICIFGRFILCSKLYFSENPCDDPHCKA